MSKIQWQKDDFTIRQRIHKCLDKVSQDFYDYVKFDLYEDDIAWDEYFDEGKPITAEQLMKFFQDRADWYFRGDAFPYECDTDTFMGTDESVPLYQQFIRGTR